MKLFFTFVRPTLSPSGEIIARISLVFVSAALPAEAAENQTIQQRLEKLETNACRLNTKDIKLKRNISCKGRISQGPEWAFLIL